MQIFESDRYVVRRELAAPNPSKTGAPIVVTFPHAGGHAAERRVAFGEVFLRSKAIDAYHLTNKVVDWFQHDSFFDALAAIREDLPEGRPVVTYGSSMGGYGALLASKRLDAARALAVVPQFSIDRNAVPWERRWKEHADYIGDFVHDIEAEISETADIFSLHDPRNTDQFQMDMYEPRSNWTRFRLPFAGHTPLVLLQQAGLLSPFVASIISGQIDPISWQCKMLKARRETRSFWRVFAAHAVRRRRIDLANHAMLRLKELGGTEPEIQTTRAAIERVVASQKRVLAHRESNALRKAKKGYLLKGKPK